MGRAAVDISKLTPDERLELIGELWDSLTPEHAPLTGEQLGELDRRLKRVEDEGSRGSSWTDVEQRVRSRHR